jgi:hypothetical protein
MNKYTVSIRVTKYGRYLRHDTIELIATDRATAKERVREIALDPAYYPMDCTATADLRTVTKLY